MESNLQKVITSCLGAYRNYLHVEVAVGAIRLVVAEVTEIMSDLEDTAVLQVTTGQ